MSKGKHLELMETYFLGQLPPHSLLLLNHGVHGLIMTINIVLIFTPTNSRLSPSTAPSSPPPPLPSHHRYCFLLASDEAIVIFMFLH